MATHDIRITRILDMHIWLRFLFWPFMLLEWRGFPSEQRREQKSFTWQTIGEQHFPGTRSIVLFYSQKLTRTLRLEHVSHKARCITETRTRISQSLLYYNTQLYYYATAAATDFKRKMGALIEKGMIQWARGRHAACGALETRQSYKGLQSSRVTVVASHKIENTGNEVPEKYGRSDTYRQTEKYRCA